MKALTFSLRLVEPLLATQPHSGEPNSRTSFPFIPGSMLRGALIAAYKRYWAVDDDDLSVNKEARQLFFDGDVCFLNAYPIHPRQNVRMLPKPLSWFEEKDTLDEDNARIYDFAVEVNRELEKPKSTKKGDFCYLSDQITYLASPARQVNVHNASTNRNRKRAIDSQVYRYDALAAKQSFAGVIVAQPEVDLTTLELLLEQEIVVLGGSHTGGYGRIEVSNIKEKTNWQEYTANNAISDPVIVTLLSDTILRTPNGQISTDLATALGVDKALFNQGTYRAYQRVRVVGGWNRKWGLPLPQTWALQAGSVFCFPAEAVDQTILQTFVERGIGERRAEGFGRIAVNWHTEPQRERYQIEKITPSERPSLSARSQELAKRMANRRLRTELEQGLVNAINKYQGVRIFKNLPSASQLSRVRLVARQAWQENDLNVIAEHLESLKGAKAEWQKARIGRSQSLLKWVKKQCELSEDEFKGKFALTGGLPEMAGVESELTDELRIEFCSRLVDGVMKLAIEQVKKERGEN